MDKFQLGFKQAIGEIVGGLITPPIIGAFTQGKEVPGWAILWFGLLLALSNIILIFSMPSWGALYTLGWILSSWLFLKSGALDTFGVVMYIIVPAGCLVARAVALFRS